MTVLDEEAARRLLEGRRVAALVAALDAEGDETRVVGGAVRDALLGRPVAEIDLATTAAPADTMRRARAAGFKPVPTGLPHGTVTVVVEGRPFEVTTLREDVETDGRHALVRFGRDFRADALRRDFTVNALSVGRDGCLHDETGGLADLAAGRLRFIGDAGTRIREDSLRILRFFRFSAEYAAGEVDRDGLDAAIRGRDGLDGLSRERVRAELLKLLAARRAAEVTGLMSEAGLLARITGGIAEIGRLARAAAADRGAPDPVGRLAACLVVSDADVERLRERLRLSNAERDRLAAFAGLIARLRSAPADRGEIRRLAFRFGTDALAQAVAVLAGEPRPALDDEAREQVERFASGAEPAPAFPFAAADLMERRVASGPALGRALADAKARWLAAGCPPGRDAGLLPGP